MRQCCSHPATANSGVGVPGGGSRMCKSEGKPAEKRDFGVFTVLSRVGPFIPDVAVEQHGCGCGDAMNQRRSNDDERG
jgi:hypothetical protein